LEIARELSLGDQKQAFTTRCKAINSSYKQGALEFAESA